MFMDLKSILGKPSGVKGITLWELTTPLSDISTWRKLSVKYGALLYLFNYAFLTDTFCLLFNILLWT